MSNEALFGEEIAHTNMDRYIGTTAVVTGASVGIGAELCEVFVKLGVNVVGVARRVELIEEQAERLSGEKGKLYARRCDLRSERQIDDLFNWIEARMGPIAILINNAGLTVPTTLIEGEPSEWRKVLDVNVMALCMCTKKAIESMKAHQQDGHIVHINSIVGHYIPEVPALNVYPASKHAVTALTEILRRELRAVSSPNIKISSVSPGLVATPFLEGFTAEGGLRDGMRGMPKLQPSDVADTIIYVLSTPPHVQIHDIIVKVTGEAF